MVEATVTVGVGEGIPCGEDVGGRKRGVAGRTSPPTTWRGINRKMLPYCESTEAFVALTEFGVMVLTKEGNTASALY